MLLVTFKKVSRWQRVQPSRSVNFMSYTAAITILKNVSIFQGLCIFTGNFITDCFLDSPIQVKANVFSSYQLGCCRSARWTDTSSYCSESTSTNHFSRHFNLLSGCSFGCICTFSRFHLTGTSLCIDLPSSPSSSKHHCLHQHYHNRVVDCNNLGCILSVGCVRHL